MEEQISKLKNIFTESAIPLDPPKSHFKIMKKFPILEKPDDMKLDTSPISPPQACVTPTYGDNISLELKTENDGDCERNMLTPGTNLNCSVVTCIENYKNQQTDRQNLESLEADDINLDQQKEKVQTCIKNLEILTSKLLQNSLKNISTEGWKKRESILRSLELRPEPETEDTSAIVPIVVSPRSKIKQKLSEIKADVENKLTDSKQTDKRFTCTDETDHRQSKSEEAADFLQNQPSATEQQLDWLQKELSKAKQALLELQADRKELLARKDRLGKSLPQLPPDVEKLKNDLVNLQTENQNIQDTLHSVLNEKQNLQIANTNLNMEIEKIVKENRDLTSEKTEIERIRFDEKRRLRDLVQYLEKIIAQWNTLISWLDENESE